jgi:hypothetical protein
MTDPFKNENDQHDTELATFNEELGRGLASVDRGESVNPPEVRSRLKRKSQERRQMKSRSLGSD